MAPGAGKGSETTGAAELPLTLRSPSASSLQGKGLAVWAILAAVGAKVGVFLCCVRLVGERQG